MSAVHPAHASEVRKLLTFALPCKHSFEEAQSPIHPRVCVSNGSPCDQWKFTACRLSSDKSTGQNEREIGVLTKAAKRAPSRATNCFPPLHYTTLTWPQPYINYQPPQRNISTTAVPFLVYFYCK